MTITIKLNTDNAAFQDGLKEQEVQDILQKWIDSGWGPRTLRDSNGNTVGSVTVRGK
jgi:hypothetical protein